MLFITSLIMKTVSVVSISILCLTAILCVPSYLNDDFARAYTLFSNIAYLAPLAIAFELRNVDFVIILSLITLVSTLYHTCKAYDVCFRLEHVSWESIDVQFSWYLLLTLSSYLAFPKKYLSINPINVLIVFWSHAAHCNNDYDCRNAKLVYLSIYFIVGIVKGVRDRDFYHPENAILSIMVFVVASAFYLFGDSDANHCSWHVFGAIGISLALTMLRTARFHFFGLSAELGNDAEKEPLLRQDLRIYYNK
tara:strand:- start:2984 stop:3736 length:753 start_codon:yes stop_codon:yes gene_type:complete